MVTKNFALFDFIFGAVIGEGGDGDITVVFVAQDHKAVAAEFAAYLSQENRGIWGRIDTPDQVIFHANMESFSFTNDKKYISLPYGCTQQVVTL
jgi:hypothetical protein